MAALRCRAAIPGDGAPGNARAGHGSRVCERWHIRQSAPGAVTRTTGNGARRRRRNGKRDERWLEGCSGVGGCRTRGWLLSDTRLLLAGIDFFTGELEEQAHGCFVAHPALLLRDGQG